MKLFASFAFAVGLILFNGCGSPNNVETIKTSSITATEIVKNAKTDKGDEISAYRTEADGKKNLVIIVGKADQVAMTSTDQITINGKPVNLQVQVVDNMIFVCYQASKGVMISTITGSAKEFEAKCKATPIADTELNSGIAKMKDAEKMQQGRPATGSASKLGGKGPRAMKK